MIDWLRLWHEMPTDPKWRTIAKRSGQPITAVIAVYNFILVNASSNSNARGTLCNWNSEDVAASLDLLEEDVDAIVREMQGRVLSGMVVTGWEKRQPKREDESTRRVREHRERARNALRDVQRNETHPNVPEALPCVPSAFRGLENALQEGKNALQSTDTALASLSVSVSVSESVSSSERTNTENLDKPANGYLGRTASLIGADGWDELIAAGAKVRMVMDPDPKSETCRDVWSVLDFGKKRLAIHGILERIECGQYDNPRYVPSLDTYLRKEKWKESLRPRSVEPERKKPDKLSHLRELAAGKGTK